VKNTIVQKVEPYNETSVHREALAAEEKLFDLLSSPSRAGATGLQSVLAEMGLETTATSNVDEWEKHALFAFHTMYDMLTEGWSDWTHAFQDAKQAKQKFADCLKRRRAIWCKVRPRIFSEQGADAFECYSSSPVEMGR
jgi:hypothetical protein